MAQKRQVNKWLLVIVGAVLLLVVLTLCSDGNQRYQPMIELPVLDSDSEPQDGDTQADTIKALQAYAKAAVEKAERLHNYTRTQSKQVTAHSASIQSLQHAQGDLDETLQKTATRINALEKNVFTLKQQLSTTAARPSAGSGVGSDTGHSVENRAGNTHTFSDIPVGLGFDELSQRGQQKSPDTGTWHDPIDHGPANRDSTHKDKGFAGLLSKPGRLVKPAKATLASGTKTPKAETVEPVYTLPKDAVLSDAIAMTALIGRIPVAGKTPDPYPVKLFIGRENLLANGHDLPEIEGMVFSGLGIGDWNLSCVSARLYSASYIFTDGTIVNHASKATDQPLGYISDPTGIPCIAGQFVTNAPQFLLKRATLAGLGTAGAAYAEAQKQTQTSGLTGNTTRTVLGDIDKLVVGDTVKSATDEVTQWLLERQKQSFDAVVVKPGVAVAVHLDTALPIDHLKHGRKIRYAKNAAIYSTLD